MRVKIPEFSIVLLVGASGSGKSSFARKHFKPTEIVSSDVARGLVCDDENAQDATADAFDLVNYIAAKRLKRRKLVVIDATNVRREDRARFIELARSYHALAVAIVLDMPEALCQERNKSRPDRDFGPHVVRNHCVALRKSRGGLRREGFHNIISLSSPEEAEALELERDRLWTDRSDLTGPFDIIGDIHGCADEMKALVEKLGYVVTGEGENLRARHAEGRTLVFVGDLVDRGPAVTETLAFVMPLVASGDALCVQGNHEAKLLKALNGRDVKQTHGLKETLEQLEEATPEFRQRVRKFIDGLRSHYVLDNWKLVVAHAGLREDMQGRGSAAVRAFALYGDTTGETDSFGLPVRYPWAADYRGRAIVVYGHTPVVEAEWLNGTICVDTGCVFGGKLTALRYPERELVSVPAARVYCEPMRPLTAEPTTLLSAQQDADDLLDASDVVGKRIIRTRFGNPITIGAEHAAAALEVMSRFAVDPKWLIYLPPTMSPVETSKRDGTLEHPDQAFDAYQSFGIDRVVCQEKHMGSRAVVIAAREGAALRRFGITGPSRGIIYTRTGRAFFPTQPDHEAALLAAVDAAMTASGLWDQLQTDWVALDCELMPWSAKAKSLLLQQYGPVGAAGRMGLGLAASAISAARARGIEIPQSMDAFDTRHRAAAAFVAAYSAYCVENAGLHDLRLAPFHVLATEGKAHTDRPHVWHLEIIRRIVEAAPAHLTMTAHRYVDLTDADHRAAAAAWWEDICAAGGEGMVVKPEDFIAKGQKGLIQPALKVRGREYLRIIYGPDYDAPQNLERLRQRGIGAKRALANREFALGLESLERFAAGVPLRQVHECVFGVLALESEPVDPRL